VLNHIEVISDRPASADGTARLLCTPQLEAHIYIAILPHSLDAWIGAGAVRCRVTAAAGGANAGVHSSISEVMPSFVDKLPKGRLERSVCAAWSCQLCADVLRQRVRIPDMPDWLIRRFAGLTASVTSGRSKTQTG